MNRYAPRLAAESLTPGVAVDRPLARGIADFAAAVVRARSVDPLITELVRLRCAQVHDCRLCGSLRTRDALEGGFEEGMNRKLARYENGDFSPETVAALRLCDAMILAPATADAALKQELERHFSATQIAELCFDVMKWSQQKALVALRTEEPPWDTTTVLSFDERGEPVFGGPAYES